MSSSASRITFLEETISTLAESLLKPREKDPARRQEERQRLHDALLKNLAALVSIALSSEEYAAALEAAASVYPGSDTPVETAAATTGTGKMEVAAASQPQQATQG